MTCWRLAGAAGCLLSICSVMGGYLLAGLRSRGRIQKLCTACSSSLAEMPQPRGSAFCSVEGAGSPPGSQTNTSSPRYGLEGIHQRNVHPCKVDILQVFLSLCLNRCSWKKALWKLFPYGEGSTRNQHISALPSQNRGQTRSGLVMPFS